MKHIVILACIVSIYVLSACSTTSTDVDKPLTGAALAVVEGQATREGGHSVKSFEVTIDNTGFTPMNMKVNRYDIVRIRITAKDGDHYFVLDDFDVSEHITDGQEKIIEFTATDKGIHNFHDSSFTGGSPRRGQLIVTN